MNLALKIIPPVQLIICAGLMVLLAFYFPQHSFHLTFSLCVSISLSVLACIIAMSALYNFHQHKTTVHPHTPEKTSTVVNTGIYAYSRNPMYLALVLLLGALAFYLHNVTCFAVIPVFICYITRYQIIPEEEMLNSLFPSDYKTYCQKVRRWL